VANQGGGSNCRKPSTLVALDFTIPMNVDRSLNLNPKPARIPPKRTRRTHGVRTMGFITTALRLTCDPNLGRTDTPYGDIIARQRSLSGNSLNYE